MILCNGRGHGPLSSAVPSFRGMSLTTLVGLWLMLLLIPFSAVADDEPTDGGRVTVTATCADKGGVMVGNTCYLGGYGGGFNIGRRFDFRALDGVTVIGNRGDIVAALNANQGKCGEGNPIIPSTGNKVEPEIDFTSSGEMPLGLSRTYNHH